MGCLYEIALTPRLQPKGLAVSPCCFAALTGDPVPAGGHRRQTAKSASQPPRNSPQRFAPPSSTPNKMRPAHAAPRQNTSTRRRSGCFGFGRFGVALRLRQAYGRFAGRQRFIPQPNTRRVVDSLHFPTACLASAASSLPCQKPCARPCTSPGGMSAALTASPRCEYGVRPPCVKLPQAAPAASLVRTEPRGSNWR